MATQDEEYQKAQSDRYALCDSGSHEFKSFGDYVCCNYCGKEPVPETIERTAEDLVRSYAKAYGETEEPTPDHYGIFWIPVFRWKDCCSC